MIQRTEADINPVRIDDERFAGDWNFAYGHLLRGVHEINWLFCGLTAMTYDDRIRLLNVQKIRVN